MDAPGGAIKSNIACNYCSTSNVHQYSGKTLNICQTPSSSDQCMSAERNARLRLRHKTVIPIAAGCASKCVNKPYFTRLEERRKYLKQDFKSNQHHNVCCNNVCCDTPTNSSGNSIDVIENGTITPPLYV